MSEDVNNCTNFFNGFDKEAANKSFIINEIFCKIVKNIVGSANSFTSTPVIKRICGLRMELSFSNYCDSAVKYELNFHATMDHDSGYISHHQESNSDSSSENIGLESTHSCLPEKPIFLSEDALLEKPDISVNKYLDLSAEIDKEDFEETRQVFYSPEEEPSVVNASVTSVNTEYSGFESESVVSDVSAIIPLAPPIVVSDRIDSGNDSVSSEDNVESKDDSVSNEINIQQEINDGVDRLQSHNDVSFAASSLAEQDCTSNNCKYHVNCRSVDDTTSKQDRCCKELETDVAISSSCIKADSTESFQVSVGSSLNKTSYDTRSSENVVMKNVTNVVNTSSNRNNEIKKLTFLSKRLSRHSLENKENIGFQKKSTSKTPQKKYKNKINPDFSPDLFSDDDQFEEVPQDEVATNSAIPEEKYILKKDYRLLKRAQTSLSGVLPPPSVTIVQLSVTEILNRLKTNTEYFWTETRIEKSITDSTEANESSTQCLNTSSESNEEDFKCLLLTTNKVEGFKDKKFPQVMEDRYLGVYYNRSKLSEEFESLCDKYRQRCIGAETQSSCSVFETNFVSPSKRKSIKQRWSGKSPGRRLSHLARRRITFSSANLQAGNSALANSRARQILVDTKKLDLLNRRKSPRKSPRKTPKKTPGKSPRRKTRTPSSSAKKKLALRFRKINGEFEKTVPSTSSENLVMSSKRALFQSPSRDKNSSLIYPSTSGLSTYDKKISSKRALFVSPIKHKNSPIKKSPFKLFSGYDKKRKRTESEESHPSKLPRSMSLDIRPTPSEAKLPRVKSDLNLSGLQSSQSGELSAIHKKKLQWAVYEALRTQNVTPTHSQFKLFASILARVTRRFLPNLSANAPRPEGGTSERMLRIARHHVYAVVKGKSVDEIISEYLKARARLQKPQGYVGIEEFNSSKSKDISTNKENIFRDRSNCVENMDKNSSVTKMKQSTENRVDRIRKVINFGDDDNR